MMSGSSYLFIIALLLCNISFNVVESFKTKTQTPIQQKLKNKNGIQMIDSCINSIHTSSYHKELHHNDQTHDIFDSVTVRVSFIKLFRNMGVGLSIYSALMFSLPTAVFSMETPKLGECITESNPQVTTQFCRQLGLTSDGRLRSCNANENCFSTSSKAAAKRTKPWRFTGSADATFQEIKVAAELEGLKILKVKDSSYILAAQKNVPKQPAGSSIFYEFLVRPEENVVLYRGVVDKTIFLYPLQQPVSDFGAIESMFDKILTRCGFQIEASI